MKTELSLTAQKQIHDTFKPIAPRLLQFFDEATIIKECNFAMQAFAKNEFLNSATPESKMQAILNVAQVGLTLNPVLKYAALVPRYNSASGKVECYFEPQYQGIVKLITDTGSAKNVVCYPVYEGDFFRPVLGSKPEIIHHPEYKYPLVITHVYAVANLHDGSQQLEIMSDEQIKAVRDTSESYKKFKEGKVKSCVWENHYSEMARKTVIKRLCKYLPKTEMWERLATAIDLDNSDYPASDEQKDYAESLLRTSNLDHDVRERYERQIPGMSISEISTLIDYLQNNQLDPITSGHSYGQREIAAKLQAEIPAPENAVDDLFNGENEAEQLKTKTE